MNNIYIKQRPAPNGISCEVVLNDSCIVRYSGNKSSVLAKVQAWLNEHNSNMAGLCI